MTDQTEVPRLGDYLKEHRQILGESLRGLGGSALQSAHMSNIETGRTNQDNVTISTLIALADAYQIPLATILQEVYGLDITPEGFDPEAQRIGEVVLALPEDRRERMIEWIGFQTNTVKSP